MLLTAVFALIGFVFFVWGIWLGWHFWHTPVYDPVIVISKKGIEYIDGRAVQIRGNQMVIVTDKHEITITERNPVKENPGGSAGANDVQ